mmetsp:Transcript_17379/g.24918  ORF Transcript_17379/g.24918 Transcript_17379/m.24918 type:complete len:343 (-) Transcript_17379:151-1179(-)
MLGFGFGLSLRSSLPLRSLKWWGRRSPGENANLIRIERKLQSHSRSFSQGFPGAVTTVEMTARRATERSSAQGPKKFYGIAGGQNKFYGVTSTWSDCFKLVKGVRNVKYKSFPSYSDAEQFVRDHDTEGLNKFEFINNAGKRMVEVEEEQVENVLRSPIMPTRTERGASTAVETIPVPASDEEHIVIYTDGACKSNGTGLAVAGYGVFFGPNDLRNKAVPLEGSVQTNNRAELQAVLTALEILLQEAETGDRRSAEVRTDSNYVKKGLTEWIHKWKQNGWRTKGGSGGVKNRDLWERLDEAKKKIEDYRSLKIEWVKGHGVDAGNIAADNLAVLGAEMNKSL